jgi:Tfp pilus assembly protein PilW
MIGTRDTIRCGFMVIELVIAMIVAAIVVLAIGAVISDSRRGWEITYNRVYSDATSDGYVAMKKYDAIVRKASGENLSVGETGSWIEVYYSSDEDSTAVDRYAYFYVDDGELKIENGQLNPRETLSVETICGNVSACTFKQAGRSAQMILTLDDGRQTRTIVSSAVAHN